MTNFISLLCLSMISFLWLVLSLSGFMLLRRHLQSIGIRLFQKDVECLGVVVNLVTRTDSDGIDVSAPTFRFSAQNGQEYTITGTVYASPPRYRIGQIVTVVYPPDNPKYARIKGEDDRQGMTLTYILLVSNIGLSVLLLLFSLLSLVLRVLQGR